MLVMFYTLVVLNILVSFSEFWGIEQSPIPYVWQVTLTYIPFKDGIFHPYKNGLLDDSGKVLPEF